MPVATAIVGDRGEAAQSVLATRDVPAEDRRSTVLDRAHNLQFLHAHMPAIGITPSGTVGAEDIRDLQGRTRHGRRLYAGGASFGGSRNGVSLSSGLMTPRMMFVATCV